jgi:hypothetical protein
MVLRRLQALIRLWRNKRQLKKLGHESWRQYRRHTDPDVFFRADRVNDYFHGYQYVHCFENHQHQIYQWDLGIDGSKEILDWCDRNISGKHRFDCLRCYQQTPIGLNGPESPEWFINDLGSGDYFFFACKEYHDMFLFKMRWA